MPDSPNPERSGFEPTQMSDSAPATPVVASSTTLGASSGQRLTGAKPRSKLPWSGGGVIGIGVVVVVVAAMMGESKDMLIAEAPPAAPPARRPAPATPKPTDVELTVTSPQPAEVYSVDHLLLGRTPYTVKRTPAQGSVVLYLRAEGFTEQRVDLPADHTNQREVTLVAVAPAVTIAKPTPPVVAKPPVTKPAELPIVKPKKPLKPGELPED